MNASTSPNDERHGLEGYVDALRASAPSDADAQGAQQRLLERLSGVDSGLERRSPRVAWWAAAGFASILALALLPALIIGPSVAFADVQRHFRDFLTLAMRIDTKVSGGPPIHTEVKVDRAGNTRVEVGQTLSVIVNVEQGQVMQLLHDARIAAIRPLGAGERAADDPLSWIDEIVEFQGEAKALPDTREIDGSTAHGYSLEVAGMTTTLWADSDGLPLAMQVADGTLVDMQFRFEFDRPIDPSVFAVEVPRGYRRAGSEP